MRYRRRGKIVHNHSTLIEGLKSAVENIAVWDQIDSVVPGPLSSGARSSKFVITVQRHTSSGLRCLAKSQGKIQELFITTSQPEVVAERLRELYPPVATAKRKRSYRPPSAATKQTPPKKRTTLVAAQRYIKNLNQPQSRASIVRVAGGTKIIDKRRQVDG